MYTGKYATGRFKSIDYERMREYRLNRTLEQMKKQCLGALII